MVNIVKILVSVVVINVVEMTRLMFVANVVKMMVWCLWSMLKVVVSVVEMARLVFVINIVDYGVIGCGLCGRNVGISVCW